MLRILDFESREKQHLIVLRALRSGAKIKPASWLRNVAERRPGFIVTRSVSEGTSYKTFVKSLAYASGYNGGFAASQIRV